MTPWGSGMGLSDVLTPHSDEINPTFPTRCFQWNATGKGVKKGELLSSPPVQIDGEAEQTSPDTTLVSNYF